MNAYRAPWWLPGSHVQTIYPYLALRPAPLEYRRERVETPDGDFVDFDWLPGGADDAPTLILFHGLEGSSRSHYATLLLSTAARRGWRGVVPHWRGCSGEPNRLPRAYHSGDHAETAWMLETLRKKIGAASIYAVGVSLGGSALLNLLGRGGGRFLTRAAAVSAPIDLPAAGAALDRGLNRIYTRNFLRTLVPKAAAKGQCGNRIRTMREFDDLVTAPLHGFAGVDDYWSRASSKPWLRTIEIPTLILNARNDPFVPGDSLPRPDEVGAAVTLEQPPYGGHVGFSSGPFPGNLDWLSDRLFSYFEDGTTRSGSPTARRSAPDPGP
jgi:predicted alpha/beta-fold hydrolase